MIKIKSLAVIGGAFDPVHFGHLKVIKRVAEMDFEKVLVMPTGSLSGKRSLASPEDRLAMLQLALEGLGVEIDSYELNKSEPSYTIDSVRELQQRFPGAAITWVVGSDILQNLKNWHRSAELASMVEILAVKRPSFEASEQDWYPWKVQLIDIEAEDLSSTQLRHLLASNRSVEPYLPQVVIDYIRKNGIYGAA